MLKSNMVDLLVVYTSILDNCKSTKVRDYLIIRIYSILKKVFKTRQDKDFPQTSYDMQVVLLVANLKDNKKAYAFLYASSLVYLINKRKGVVGRKKRGIATQSLLQCISDLFKRKHKEI